MTSGAVAGEAPRFLVDGMLGRLARWLRLLGYDAEYANDVPDSDIVRRARAEGRIVLTCDTGLARRRALRVLLIRGERVDEQLAQVVAALGLVFDGALTRCPVCNMLLDDVAREAVRQRVPPYVYGTQRGFRQCPGCGRVYWRGTHWQRIWAAIERATPAPSAPTG